MLKSEYIAHRFLTPVSYKVQKIMAMQKPYAFRLAAIIATDTNKGKVWA